ncbi:MAG: hypothetical protein KUG59_09645 [Parvibaculaceae bacterium]|nr:hypothetical protein [Parvibaculaceae bacterium]
MRYNTILPLMSAAMLVAMSNIAVAKSEPVGVLGLYKADAPEKALLNDMTLDGIGCKLQRAGVIVAEQGGIDLEQPNQFVLLACESSVLADTTKRAAFKKLTGGVERIGVVEGDLMNFPDGLRESDVGGRQYIFKLSYYNNRDVDARDTDLAMLGEAVGKVPDAYVNETFIGVNHASGLATPDEVVVLFYDNAQAADRFRANNKDLLGKIGAFNKAHVTNSVYYIGQVSQ